MTSPTLAATSVAPARSSLGVLTLGALGVVFGDIGTSPLYAFKAAFAGAHPLAPSAADVYGILSLIFWAVTLIVSLKYILFVLRFDNNGEGGVLALLAFATRLLRDRPRLRRAASTIAILAASLFYGDAVITPAISVLSAVEGLSVAAPTFEQWILPITLAILIGLYAIQSRGTGRVGKVFGPVTAVWFLALAALGAASIAKTPGVLAAVDPRHAAWFVIAAPGAAFLSLGVVFLAITGAEALYADMGHFGPRPIRIGWFGLAFPALMLNYFGQGALVLREPGAVANPFFGLAPPEFVFALVVLAAAATVIASQATISGAFSVTQQASRLGYLPRIPARHTSESERGQIYIGRVNWTMLVLVVALVIGFGSSNALAAAYGIAVSATITLETALVVLVVIALPGRAPLLLIAGLVLVGLVELAFFGANSTKINDGGWFPLVCGIAIFVLLTTWKRAAEILTAAAARRRVPLAGFIESVTSATRVPGTAIYFSADPDAVPTTMLHNLKHNGVVHERVLFFTIVNEDVPRVANDERTEVRVLEPRRAYQVSLHYGFMEDPEVVRDLKLLGRHGLAFELSATTFFLGKATIARAPKPGLFTWRRELFRWMQRNSPTAAEYFRLPPDRVIELGTQLSL